MGIRIMREAGVKAALGAAAKENAARDYDSAIARFALVQAQEAADPSLNPICYSKLLTHGRKMERAIILMHGMTNCPQQYVELAPLFYKRGYNVLIPRMPRNGLADLDTEALKYLTAAELRDSANDMVDIARGLGNHLTYLGLSVGGTMAAWVAQYRADVDQVVLIAPAFTYKQGIGVRQSRFMMHVFLLLPNIMTQRFRPFTGGPAHNYHGFATRGLGVMMRLGFSVYDAARTTPAAAQSVLVITNAVDPAVENSITRKLVDRWLANGLDHCEEYQFDAKYKLIHDIIDPEQAGQQTALVYPILMELVTREKGKGNVYD